MLSLLHDLNIDISDLDNEKEISEYIDKIKQATASLNDVLANKNFIR